MARKPTPRRSDHVIAELTAKLKKDKELKKMLGPVAVGHPLDEAFGP